MSSDWYGEGKYVAQEWVLVSTKIVSWQRFSCHQLTIDTIANSITTIFSRWGVRRVYLE